jgi:hypothetical protein
MAEMGDITHFALSLQTCLRALPAAAVKMRRVPPLAKTETPRCTIFAALRDLAVAKTMCFISREIHFGARAKPDHQGARTTWRSPISSGASPKLNVPKMTPKCVPA